MDEHHRHAAMVSTRGSMGQASGQAAQVTQVSSFKESMQLEDPRFLDIVPEPWWQLGEQMPTAVMTTLFPSVIFQQQVNSVSTRHIQPDGHGAFDFVWTHFGFEAQHRALVELGGREVGETDHMVTETLIRGMYEYWRKVMEAPEAQP